MFRSIVVGTDGSSTASAAVAQATALARVTGAKLTIVCAYKPLEPFLAVPEAMAASLADAVRPHEEAGRVVEEATAKAKAEGVEVAGMVCAADPATAIIEVAEQQGADLIVVGNRGMTGKARFLLGSVPNKISHHAPCAVLIARTTG